MTTATNPLTGDRYLGNPWHALWAMIVGFFMIMVDSTIVAIANPTIMAEMHIGYATVVWVTSAYLLGFAVVLLVAGRLGDRYGPKNLYLVGLVLFTAASVWCGLSGSAAMLIAARVVQGVGAGVLTPQTLSMITRIFPARRRGTALSMWGATAGVASLVAPLAGGVLVDTLGWQWIFFVNVPVGVIGLVVAVWLLPVLPVHAHRFDLIGVALSGIGMFGIVFALQEGQSAEWAPWIWAVLVAGVGFMSAFVYWQSINRDEPLIPLRIFRDPDFSLSSIGVAITAFATTAMMLPLIFYIQAVCGLSPTRSAVLIAPMAITSGVLAPFVGRIVDRAHPVPVIGFGFSMLAISMTWMSIELDPDTPIWRLVLPLMASGVGMAFVWSPLAATATRHLPPELAGASSGVFNATRQLGAVLGSAGMAAFMTAQISDEMPPTPSNAADSDLSGAVRLPGFLREPFSTAMSQSMLLPAFISLLGIVTALFMLSVVRSLFVRRGGYDDDLDYAGDDFDEDDYDDYDDYDDEGYDDDAYVEYVLRPEPQVAAPPVTHGRPPRGPQQWRGEPADRWAPVGAGYNGSHLDGRRARPVADYSRRPGPDRPASYGRHSE